MHRFFVPPASLQSEPLVLEPPTSRQLSRVLRMSAGDQIILLANDGLAHRVELDHVSPTRCTAHRIETFRPYTEPYTHITLCQALPKGKKLDWVLQKGTELGVSAFAPMITERSISMRSDERSKRTRWRRIVTEAAEQSGRALIPEIMPIRRYDEILSLRPTDTTILVATPKDGQPLGQYLSQISDAKRLAVLIGPEGGLSESEIDQAMNHSAIPISLGPRILRTETAGLAALSVLLFALGDMD